ncbi:MAG: hypothetical protein H6745_06435 [Deltaproteobacteria bacterium]|nr:hypothetical protein [Deltaproteobacteria bacterium]
MGAALCLAASPAIAADPTDVLVDPPTPAATPEPEGSPAAGAATVTSTDTVTGETPASGKDWSASLTVETSIGLGTFVSEPQRQSSVTTAFVPSFSYKLAKDLSIRAGFSVVWYNVLDYATPLPENEFLMSDLAFTLAHGRIWKHDDSGFTLSGALTLSLPTSLASQFQNRLFTLAPSLSARLPVGPVTFAYTLGFGKYFNTTASSTVNCDDFDDPAECRQGREDNPDQGYESERRGAEVYLPGSGSSSFYVQNGLSVTWEIVEGLNLGLGVTIYNTFGTRSFEVDGLSSEHATSGRSQTDRLISSLELSYDVLKQLTVGVSLVTGTTQPFGEQGNDLVIFDFSRASDNITSLNFSLTGTL